MSTLRAALIPIDHVIAEFWAFPLASEDSFHLATMELREDMKDKTADLWRRAETAISRACPSFSLDELIEIRDRTWFGAVGGHGQGSSLARYLRFVAEANLQPHGGSAMPRVRETKAAGDRPESAGPARWRQAWRWLTFALPADMLLATLSSEGCAPRDVTAVSPLIARMLADRGFAETHLHLGAAPDFALLWAAMLHRLSLVGESTPDLKSPGADFGEGRDFPAWLLRTAVARYFLGAFLGRRQAFPAATGSFVEYMRTAVRRQLRCTLSDSRLLVLEHALRELAAGRLADDSQSFADLQAQYLALTRVPDIAAPRQRLDFFRADPLYGLLPAGDRQGNAELALVRDGLAYLLEHQDAGFAVLFWQCLRVRNLFYRHLVQRPMTPGLQWFVRAYGRIKAAREPLLQVGTLVECALERSGLGRGLRSLEVRKSPDEEKSPVLDFVDTAATVAARTAGDPVEFGIVFHLAKVRGKDSLQGKPQAHWAETNADPTFKGNSKNYRYSGYYVARRCEALVLVDVLLEYPHSLEVIRGIDLCTDELGVPNWVLKPLYDGVRNAGRLASRHLAQARGCEVPPLRCTVHAGEDFVHLLTGLRNLSDAIVRLDLREGDRVGHGVALGIDGGEWARQRARIPMPREERLFDLAWEWTCYSRCQTAVEAARMAYIEDETSRLSREIFGGAALRPSDVACLLDDLHDTRCLRRIGFPESEPPRGVAREHDLRAWLLLHYLTDPEVFRRGRESEWIDPSDEGQVLSNLRQGLLQEVAARGLTVEINPSSNLLIGHLGELQSHPLWGLRPPIPAGKTPPVSVCIGSDDPITFCATLPAEYMLVHDALVLAGVSSDDASRWLEDTRRAGWQARFTISRQRPSLIRHYSVQGLRRYLDLPP